MPLALKAIIKHERSYVDTKVCPMCRVFKPYSEYHKNPGRSKGLSWLCKNCRAIYMKTPAQKEWRLAYWKTAGRVAYRKTQNAKRSKAKSGRKYRHSLVGKQTSKRGYRKYVKKYPYKLSAIRKLWYAIKSGKIAKPKACSFCGKETVLHGHHPDYSQPLKAVWLCLACHKTLHLLGQSSLADAQSA